jgi:hypothetical protein
MKGLEPQSPQTVLLETYGAHYDSCFQDDVIFFGIFTTFQEILKNQMVYGQSTWDIFIPGNLIV